MEWVTSEICKECGSKMEVEKVVFLYISECPKCKAIHICNIEDLFFEK